MKNFLDDISISFMYDGIEYYCCSNYKLNISDMKYVYDEKTNEHILQGICRMIIIDKKRPMNSIPQSKLMEGNFIDVLNYSLSNFFGQYYKYNVKLVDWLNEKIPNTNRYQSGFLMSHLFCKLIIAN